jgi:hypothetical protein
MYVLMIYITLVDVADSKIRLRWEACTRFKYQPLIYIPFPLGRCLLGVVDSFGDANDSV